MGERLRAINNRPAVVLVALLVISGCFAGWLSYVDIRTGGMEQRWRYEATAGAQWILPRFIDDDGSIIAEESGNSESHLLSFSQTGKLEWTLVENGPGYPEQGPDGKLYLVNEVSAGSESQTSRRNLTSVDSSGNIEWDYIAEDGTLEIWGIYPDGEVIVHDYMHDLGNPYNETLSRIVAVENGVQRWSIGMPLPNCSWSNAMIAQNGTFVVNAVSNTGPVARYEVGISKDASAVYATAVKYFVDLLPSEGHNETLLFEERRYYLDNYTSDIGAYAISLSDGTIVWKTELYQSDNPSRYPAGVWESKRTILDSTGTIYCGLLGKEHSYALSTDGHLLWERPYIGWMVAAFPSGGVLAWDNASLKLIGPDGAQIWRHYTSDEGSLLLVGSDGSIYYGSEGSLVALKRATGLSIYQGLVVVIVVADAALVLVAMWTRQRRSALP